MVQIKDILSSVLEKYDVLIHKKELRIQNDLKDETMYIGKTALNIILSNRISNRSIIRTKRILFILESNKAISLFKTNKIQPNLKEMV